MPKAPKKRTRTPATPKKRTRTPAKTTGARQVAAVISSKTVKKTSKKRSASSALSSKKVKPEKTSDGTLDAFLAPTALVYAEEELAILALVVKHPALGGAAIHRWSLRTKPGVPKRDLPAFKEAMSTVDVAARVHLVVKKLEKAWRTKLGKETAAAVREDIEAMYRGE